MSKNKGTWTDPKDQGFDNPFAALGGDRPDTRQGAPRPADDAGSSKQETLAPPKRAVVRKERKGRGGKTVTLVSHLGLPADQLSTWCRNLRSSLGCGGAVEGDLLVLQGDQRARVVAWLKKQGVRRISQS